MAGNKYTQRNAAGTGLIEKNTPQTSADSPASGDIPALSTAGKLSTDLLPATTSSAGAGDVGKLPLLDGTGRLDSTVMPVGIGADTGTIQASEALAAGDLVNVWDNAGSVRVRKADGTTTGKEAHGFVLASVSNGANATVYFEGTNTQATGLTGGPVFLSVATAGLATNTVPSGAGKTSQMVGFAVSPTAFNFQAETPITLA